jgi:hypothetical protein
MQKGEMIISHITQANIPRRTRVEKAAAERVGVKDPCGTEACLGADEGVEEPGCVGEVGTHARVWGADEVEED